MKFQDVINALALSVNSWEKRELNNSKRSQGVNKNMKEFVETLIEIYGQPDYRSINTFENMISISSNPNVVIASPGSSDNQKGRKCKWGWAKVVIFSITFTALGYFLIYSLFL